MNSTLVIPQAIVKLDGTPLANQDAATLEKIRVQQRLSLPALCELTFINPQGPLAGGAVQLVGSSLRVELHEFETPLFAGEVTAVEYKYSTAQELEVHVRAYDLLHRLRKQQPVRAHLQVKLADLTRELAANEGLTVSEGGPGPLWRRLIQYDQSDLGFLQELAERCGFYFTLRDKMLHIITLEGMGDALPLKLGATLLEARFEVNVDASCPSVSASGWDSQRVEGHQAGVKTARSGREVKADISTARFGASERRLTNQSVHDDVQAEAFAQAELDARTARLLTVTGVAEGDTRLRPGTRVVIHGAAEAVNGTYVLTSVTHTVERDRGFVSEISSEVSVPPARTKAASATVGVVTAVNDPDNLGRVQASLPAYGNVETDWMPVLATGAGSKKGLVALPDVGDQVLVLCLGEDPAEGIALGGLYGTNAPPDWGVQGGTVRRYSFSTPGGQAIRLDDSGRLVRLENSDGSYIELSPGKVKLHSQADLEVEAPGRSVVFRGNSVDFQKA
jgi:phage baseplate assembly protein V